MTRGIIAAQLAYAFRGAFRNPIRLYKYGGGLVAYVTDVRGILPALGPDHKVGIRYGGIGRKPFGEAYPLLSMYMLPHVEAFPVPAFGLALTAVPNDSSRIIHETNKSRGGEHAIQSSGTPVAEPSISGLSAKKSGQYIRRSRMTKGDAAVTRGARTRTRPKTVPYRKGGCPPGYRYDRRKKMCVRT